MKVNLDTTEGRIVLDLDTENAPKTTANFAEYVRAGFYDGTIFHRVIEGFMIQGGGFEPGMSQKSTNAPIENEANNGLKNREGSIAMARTSDPHSASSQFFICLTREHCRHLDNEYTAFGKVTDGMDVVEAIAAVDVEPNSGRPVGDPPSMTKVRPVE